MTQESRPLDALDVLAFAPHPDDAELFAGGLLATLTRRGYRVGIVDLTRGERATNGDPETRQAEADEAARVLGLVHRENLALPDAALAFWTEAEGFGADTATGRILNVIRRLRPEFVVAPPRAERHPDHEVAGALVRRAVFLAGLREIPDSDGLPPHRPRQTWVYPMRQELTPSFIIDVSAVADVKRAAILAHASQVGQGGTATLVGNPLAIGALDARDRYYGAMIGVPHGEPFVVEEALGLTDPVAHFRSNPCGPAHFYPARSRG